MSCVSRVALNSSCPLEILVKTERCIISLRSCWHVSGIVCWAGVFPARTDGASAQPPSNAAMRSTAGFPILIAKIPGVSRESGDAPFEQFAAQSSVRGISDGASRHPWLVGPARPLSCAILLRSSPGWPSVATRITHALRPWPVVRPARRH